MQNAVNFLNLEPSNAFILLYLASFEKHRLRDHRNLGQRDSRFEIEIAMLAPPTLAAAA